MDVSINFGSGARIRLAAMSDSQRCRNGPLAILSGGDKWLEAQVVRRMSDAWLNLTVGI
jgi:hypothetical protein